MITISKSYSFDSAHQLYNQAWDQDQNDRVFGKCARLHGHTYTLTVFVTGEIDYHSGMVINFFDLDTIMKPIITELDHKFLNDVFDVLTTSENMVAVIADRIDQQCRIRDIRLQQVELSETPRTKAIWTP